MILKFRPSVITLDIKTPSIDGLSFLGKIMRDYPTSVVMVSYFTQEGAATTLSSLELGTVDFIGKPAGTPGHGVSEFRQILVERVRDAAEARVTRRSMAREMSTLPRLKNSPDTRSLIAIGSSTGETEAIKDTFKAFPANSLGTGPDSQRKPPQDYPRHRKRLPGQDASRRENWW
jgi:two-component system chemotaxis response regulator CheB